MKISIYPGSIKISIASPQAPIIYRRSPRPWINSIDKSVRVDFYFLRANQEKKKLMNCSLCTKETSELTSLNLYVSGSEGIRVCLECRSILTEVARGIKSTANRAFMIGFKKREQIKPL